MAITKTGNSDRTPVKNSKEITLCVMQSRFPIQRYVCVPNVWWGLLPWEADFIAMSGSGYLSEVEVKISLADLKNDAKKHKWKTPEPKKLIKNMWYAMPEKLANNPKIMDHIPDFAGILSCYSIEKTLRTLTTENM